MSPGPILPGQMSPRGLANVKDGPRSLALIFGQIGPVIAEIFLIWTNVTRSNVDWKKVTVKVGICSIYF